MEQEMFNPTAKELCWGEFTKHFVEKGIMAEDVDHMFEAYWKESDESTLAYWEEFADFFKIKAHPVCLS